MNPGELTIEPQGSIIYAAFSGEVDLANADELRDELSAATPNDAAGVIFDLSGVDYLDSAGLRVVHRLREDLRVRGQGLRLVVPPESVIHDVLRLAGLDWSDEITETVESARQALEREFGGTGGGAPAG